MGFVGDIMSGKYGIEWYSIIGLLIFIVLFVIILVRTIRMTKIEIIDYKESIFDPEDRNIMQ